LRLAGSMSDSAPASNHRIAIDNVGEGSMSEQQNLEVVRRVYAAFGRGDLEGILALLDPQVSWRTPGPPDLPTAGLRRGIAEVREFFGVLLNTFDLQEFRPTDFLTGGEKVVVLGTSREGPKGAGRLVDFRWVHVFTFRNGKIAEFEEPADVSALVDEFRRAQVRT
jgi:ketosteroid isomerase-like protein